MLSNYHFDQYGFSPNWLMEQNEHVNVNSVIVFARNVIHVINVNMGDKGMLSVLEHCVGYWL